MSNRKEHDRAAACPIYFGDHCHVGDSVMRQWSLDRETRQAAGADSELNIGDGADEPEEPLVTDGRETIKERTGAEGPVGVEEQAETGHMAGATGQCTCDGPAVGPLNIIAAALPVDWTSCNWLDYVHGDEYYDDHDDDDDSYDSSDNSSDNSSYSSEEDDRRRRLSGFVVIFSDSSDGSGSWSSTENIRSTARSRQPLRARLKRKRTASNRTHNSKNKKRKK